MTAQPLLDRVSGPADLRALGGDELRALATEIRAFLVEHVTRTGGHLGPNLGVVELTLAVHRVFRSPRDAIVFDTGHQSYVHKIVTGRRAEFVGLRSRGGLSGYPSRAESAHDVVENSHASTALSYADGITKADRLRGRSRHVVAVVGDGALTGGLSWEALNNIADDPDRPLVVVVNDNGRSYAPTVGGLARHLAAVRSGSPAPAATLFDVLGLPCVGPVDGHDIDALEAALTEARGAGRAVVVHVVTAKGRGYPPAERDDGELMHAIGVLDAATGLPSGASAPTWTSAFGAELVRLGEERPDIVAITAAMPGPTGLDAFAARFPERCFDVGIAEQHALTCAAGLAMGGLHPVVVLYATFLNRAYDQLLMDVALHGLPVTLVLDRAGITGPDGASHHGTWDLALTGGVPGIGVCAPRDATSLGTLLRDAVRRDGPTVLRFPKAAVGADLPAETRHRGVDVLRRGARGDVLLVAAGALAATAVAAADALAGHDVQVTVVDPCWVTPVPAGLVELAGHHRLVVTLEDGARHGGFGWALAAALRDAGVEVPIDDIAAPVAFHAHGSRAELLGELGLSAPEVARRIAAAVDPGPGRRRPRAVPLVTARGAS